MAPVKGKEWMPAIGDRVRIHGSLKEFNGRIALVLSYAVNTSPVSVIVYVEGSPELNENEVGKGAFLDQDVRLRQWRPDEFLSPCDEPSDLDAAQRLSNRFGLMDWACPRCEQRPVNEPDYICEECRYG